jgi:hypothetical protein
VSAGTCREPSCRAQFLWAKTTKGRNIPIDAKRDPVTGKLVPLVVADGRLEDTGETAWGIDGLRIPVVRALNDAEVAQASLTPRWQAHHVTCTKPQQFRGRGRRNPSRSGSGRRPRWDE